MYVYAKNTVAVTWGGHTVRLVRGEAWHASDPFVADHRDQFSAEPTVVRGQAPVEQATAAPGEKRRTKRRTESPESSGDE